MPGWRHPGDGLDPAQIVAGLHEQIAAKSPELARLVARYEAVMAARPQHVPPMARGADALRQDRLDRIARYGGLRDAGMSRAQAAAELDVSDSTALRYERACQRERQEETT
jgi:hypothetical protein